MSMLRNITVLGCLLAFGFGFDVEAEPKKSRAKAQATLDQVCPAAKRTVVGSRFFYKNNKPIRDTSRPGDPVVGNNPVLTLAGQPGSGPRLFRGTARIYAKDGTAIGSAVPYSCRADHCSGRVVGGHSGSTRRAAIKAAGSPSGYIKIDSGVCVFIKDFGRCEGGGVSFNRPLCDRTVT